MNQDLPPQAYTRETLQEAFNWLQEQPEPVRATVHTPERLVSLYQKAQRMVEYDAPVSSKKFIDDLKNLASSLDQFGGQIRSPKTSLATKESAQALNFQQPQKVTTITEPDRNDTRQDLSHSFLDFSHPEAEIQTHQAQGQSQSTASTLYESTQTTETKKSVIKTELKSSVHGAITQDLDSVSLQRVREVKTRFNLGSDAEALRLLVSLGFEKFSQFP